ncbi:hypothetical protein SDC9_142423 [bioreactor metagenome]|uniref:Uncharacterized protein n=1 Tax=bioreactor metagenome TaxID=1076179 RepID=A0A645E148_9ZZZZ
MVLQNRSAIPGGKPVFRHDIVVPHTGMGFYLFKFFLRQRSGLLDNPFADKYLSNVMQQSAAAQSHQIADRKIHGDPQDDGQYRHIERMRVGIAVKAAQVQYVHHHVPGSGKLLYDSFHLGGNIDRADALAALLGGGDDFADSLHGFHAQLIADYIDDLDVL